MCKNKDTHRLREWNYGCQEKAGGRDSQGVWDGHVHTAIFKWITNKVLRDFPDGSDGKASAYNVGDWVQSQGWEGHCRAQGTLLNIMWQPGWEGSLGENRYMYGWVLLLATWNYHDIVNQLYPHTKWSI